MDKIAIESDPKLIINPITDFIKVFGQIINHIKDIINLGTLIIFILLIVRGHRILMSKIL